MAKTGSEFAVVTRRKTNARGAPLAVRRPDARIESETARLIRFMFSYNPKGKRKPVCVNGRQSPPWAYASDAFPSNSIEFIYHPDVYKTRMCPDGDKCRDPREKCGYLHPHEVFLPPWRCQGLVVDGYWYPPDPVTYEWFRYLMLEFKTGEHPCRVKRDHDMQRCPHWHIQAEPTDRREPVRLNLETGRWIPLPNNSPLTAVRFHPMSYKRQACIFIESQREKCIRGRYCTHSHLGDEIVLIPRYLEKLKQELLASLGHPLTQLLGGSEGFASDGYPSPPLSSVSSVAHTPPASPRLYAALHGMDVISDPRARGMHHMVVSTRPPAPETITPPNEEQLMRSQADNECDALAIAGPFHGAGADAGAGDMDGMNGTHDGESVAESMAMSVVASEPDEMPQKPAGNPHHSYPMGGGYDAHAHSKGPFGMGQDLPPLKQQRGNGHMGGPFPGPFGMPPQHGYGMHAYPPQAPFGHPYGNNAQWRPEFEPQGQSSMFSTQPFPVTKRNSGPHHRNPNHHHHQPQHQPPLPQQQQQGHLPEARGPPAGAGFPGGNDATWLASTSWSAFAAPTWSPQQGMGNNPGNGVVHGSAALNGNPGSAQGAPVVATGNPKYRSWNADDVMRWVTSQNDNTVQAAAQILRANDIDGSLLTSLDDHCLRDMGMQSFGMRAKLLAAIAKLSTGMA